MKGPSFSDPKHPKVPGIHLYGSLNGTGLKIAIVASSYNSFVTSELVKGATEALIAQGLQERDVTISWVPGSFEIPLVAQQMARSGRWNAIVCVGAIIRGETAHFDYVAAETARGIASVSLNTGVPVTFGILTTYDENQALDRSGGRSGNKGHDAALAAIQMVNLLSELS